MNRIDRGARLAGPVLVIGLMLAAGACASTGATDSNGSNGSRDVITAEDLSELRNMTAFEAVRRLKPNWLRTRGQDTFYGSTSLSVMVNEVRQGGVETLDSYQIGDVLEMRYLDSRRAIMKYGTGMTGPAIEVTLSR